MTPMWFEFFIAASILLTVYSIYKRHLGGLVFYLLVDSIWSYFQRPLDPTALLLVVILLALDLFGVVLVGLLKH